MNKRELKNKHLELNESEPFTEKEQKRFDKKDRSMIRNIQILNKFDKKQAINLLKTYKGTSKNALKKLASVYRESLKKTSEPRSPVNRGHIINQGKKKEPTVREKGARVKQRKDVARFLSDPAKKNKANYEKIKKAHKKYIDASLQELSHGVNSKWSQNYREKKGLSRKYTGRVVK